MLSHALTTTRSFDLLKELPMVRQLRRRRYDRRFSVARNTHLFRGVFESFEAAAASAPAGKPLSYDNPASAAMYIGELDVKPSDYPAMFWMQRSFAEGLRSVFDVGGNIGMKYLAYRRLIPFPADVTWLVNDMEAVIERGRKVAAEYSVDNALRFATTFDAGNGCDILLASGSLQYLPRTLAELLAGIDRLPRRLIVNTTPIHPERSFFTLNNIGTAFCPYRVQAREAFVTSLTQAGYRLRDHWLHPGKGMIIPFMEGHGVESYSGFCFDRHDQPAAASMVAS